MREELQRKHLLHEGESEDSEAAAEGSRDTTRSKDTTMLVQESWELVEKDLDTHGIKFFMRIFEIAPAALQLFSFRDDPDLHNSPQLRKHAGEVMRTVGQAVAGLEDVAALMPVLQALGKRHAGYGVVSNHFPIVGEALLWTLEQGLVDKWTPEVKAAWTETWDLLVSVISPSLVSAAHRDILQGMPSLQASTNHPGDTERYQGILRDAPQDVLSTVKQPNGVEEPSGGAPNGGAPGIREPTIKVWSRAGSFADVGKAASSSPHVSGLPRRDTPDFHGSVPSDGSLKCPFAGGCVCVWGLWRMGGWMRVTGE